MGCTGRRKAAALHPYQCGLRGIARMSQLPLSAELVATTLTAAGLLLALVTLVYAFRGTKDTLNLLKENQKLSVEVSRAIQESGDLVRRLIFDDITSRLFDNIQSNTKLAKRVSSEFVSEKRQLGTALVQGGTKDNSYSGIIAELLHLTGPKPCIFIESGSTFAYLGLALSDWLREGKKCHPIIITNNILVQHTLVYERGAAVELLAGTPAGQYGATFGDSVPSREPQDVIRKWRSASPHGERLDAVDEIESAEYYIGSVFQHEAMLGDLRRFFERQDLKRLTGKDDDEPMADAVFITTSQLSLVDGPHVGSFQNRDFKELLVWYAFEKKIPVYLVVCADKIHAGEMNVEKCVSIFGPESLKKWRHEGPRSGFLNFAKLVADGHLGLIVTCGNEESRDKADRLEKRLRECGQKNQGYKDNFELLEPRDRKVRVFQATGRMLEAKWTSNGLVPRLRDRLRHGGYNSSSLPPRTL